MASIAAGLLLIGLLAGLCAYAITADEFGHHFTSPRQARVHALRSAAVSAPFFIALGAIVLLVIARVVPG